MSDAFDPYYSWLGISPAEQPADHYRLLGISRFESNEETIVNAADRRARHVQTFQLGENAQRSQTLLNELATARVCLLNTDSKAAYDQQIYAQLGEQNPPPVASPLPATRSRAKRSGRSPVIEFGKIVLGGIAGIVIANLLLWYGFRIDILGVMESSDKHIAKSLAQSNADVQPKQLVAPKTIENRNLTSSSSVQEEPTEHDESETMRPPRALLPDDSLTPPLSNAPVDAEKARGDEQMRVVDQGNRVSAKVAPEDLNATRVRSKVPPSDALVKAVATARSVFADDYDAANKPAEKINLATKLLEIGLDTTDDLANRYVTIRSARNVAVEGGDIDLAFRALEALSDSFDVDILAVQVRLVVDLSKVVLTDEESTKLKARITEFRRQAFSDDRYTPAATLNQTAERLGKATDMAWRKSNEEWGLRLDAGASEFELVKEAIKTLEESPDDPGANLVVGRYRCLLKGEWQSGLPYLAKGSDAKLRRIAEEEIVSSTAMPNKTLALADLWWNLAVELSEIEKRNVQSRAAHLYQWALPNLVGLSAAKAEKRLRELQKLGIEASVLESNAFRVAETAASVDNSPVPALAIAPFDSKQAKDHQQAWADYLDLPVRLRNWIGIEFVLIPPGVFTMGSPGSEEERSEDEELREVHIAYPFYLSVTEITQSQFEAVLHRQPSHFRGPNLPVPNLPVEKVTWVEASLFCEKLTEFALPRIVSGAYRLPSEEEWEYACRAGTVTRFSFGDESEDFGAYGWYGNNSGSETIDSHALWLDDSDQYAKLLSENGCRTHAVGVLRPNPFGLYDMHGNVWEWCQNACEPSSSTHNRNDEVDRPKFHVRRSGSWFSSTWSSRSARRYCHWDFQQDYTQGLRSLFELNDELLARVKAVLPSSTRTGE